MTSDSSTINSASARPLELRDLPVDTKAGLDPNPAQIVSYRASGLSLNHIMDRPRDSGQLQGDMGTRAPYLLCPTEEAIEQLMGHHAFRPHTTPIQLLDKATDPFLPRVKPHLFQVLHALDGCGYTNHVLITTRCEVTEADMAALESLEHLRVTLLFSYTGISDERLEPATASGEVTLASMRTATAHKGRTGVVLYWRPIVPGWNDTPEAMARVFDASRDADAIVFSGYYHKPENAAHLRGLGVEVPYTDSDHARRKILPAHLDAQVVAAWRASGITTPLFRKTSCGVSYTHSAADYNGHFGVPEICDICPAKQRLRCGDAYTEPTPADVDAALAGLGYRSEYLIEDGHVWTHGLGEQKRYALQHTLRHQSWDAGQPGGLDAPGGSPSGNPSDPAWVAALAGIRDHFEHAVRYEDR